MILSVADACEACRSLQLHLLSYASLAHHFYNLRLMLYKLRCKSHYLWHVSLEVKEYQLNPNLFHVFAEESFLGKVKSIATKCHGRSCTRRIYQRYFLLLGLVLQWHRKLEMGVWELKNLEEWW